MNVIYTAGAFLVLLGLVPKIGALTTIIPTPVLVGAMVAMKGMVVAYGIKMLSKVGFASQENLLIIACSVGMGLGVTAVPELFAQMPSSIRIFTDNRIVAGSLTAIVLNLVFNVFNGNKVVKKAAFRSRRLLKIFNALNSDNKLGTGLIRCLTLQ